MEIGAICGLVVLVAFLSVLLRSWRPEWALLLSAVTGIGVSLTVVLSVSSALKEVNALLDRAAIGGDTALLLVKALGICLLTQLAADVCKDAGESGMAGRAELAGKAALLLLALPLFRQLVDLSVRLMSGGST